MRYTKETSRITIKYIDGDTNEELFEIPNRTILDVPELLADVYLSQIAQDYLGDSSPKRITALIIAQYERRD